LLLAGIMCTKEANGETVARGEVKKHIITKINIFGVFMKKSVINALSEVSTPNWTA